jgi:hypothetical protein
VAVVLVLLTGKGRIQTERNANKKQKYSSRRLGEGHEIVNENSIASTVALRDQINQESSQPPDFVSA